MKLIVLIGNVTVLLSPEQLDALVTLLDGSEVINNKYIGGSHGSNYLELIEPLDVRKVIEVRVLPTTQYDGMALITKLHLESELAKKK